MVLRKSSIWVPERAEVILIEYGGPVDDAAGKSNAIEALRLLSWLAQGQKLSSIQDAVNSADRVVRGRVDDLCHRGQSQFGLGCVTDDLH